MFVRNRVGDVECARVEDVMLLCGECAESVWRVGGVRGNEKLAGSSINFKISPRRVYNAVCLPANTRIPELNLWGLILLSESPKSEIMLKGTVRALFQGFPMHLPTTTYRGSHWFCSNIWRR